MYELLAQLLVGPLVLFLLGPAKNEKTHEKHTHIQSKNLYTRYVARKKKHDQKKKNTCIPKFRPIDYYSLSTRTYHILLCNSILEQVKYESFEK